MSSERPLPPSPSPPAPAQGDPAQPIQEVVLVGPGRLGRSMALALRSAGVRVRLIGRGEVIPATPLTWLTVPERELASVAARVPAVGVLLHASGASGIEVLRPHPCVGSLHPLMTFPGPEQAMPSLVGLPAAVDGDPLARSAALALAATLGMRPFELSGDRRLYHAAAVLSGNFGTVLLAAASELLVAAGADPAQAPGLLLPLARQSLDNAVALGPARALTGPVARGEQAVIDQHRAAIAAACPHLLDSYDSLARLAQQLARPAAADTD